MNRLKGNIVEIESCDGISLVAVQTTVSLFSTVLLDTPESCHYLKLHSDITVAFKETKVAIALTNLGDISMANQIKCTIKSMKVGKILTQIELTCKGKKIVSIITTRSSLRLGLKEKKEVIALIKANEISLMERD